MILLFGFEPFQEYRENPAELIVRSLDGFSVGGERVRGVVLPVEYDKVEKIISSHITELKPILTLGIGLAPGRAKLTPEKVALNYKYSKEPDNSGTKGKGERIDPAGPDGIFNNLPVEDLVDYLNSKGIPAELSLSAGSYLCNMAMYIIVREAKRLGSFGGFIHVPCHEELAAKLGRQVPSMSLETMKRGITLSLEFLLNAVRPRSN
ncbi:pyroglutamyl-peptidase I [Metallosphaera hakonensis]|uniref:Pyroglutamyl-peptidase I n=1 Tax=Metallosphaera hakonensis JCM 8857 = DSM 7519 TaxID=1293036 RepID=A0A2U9IUY7_9CREN|nr:pyroglutamyl-peptidase I [Metallosphaera hakonensis]AWR99866.1 pyroglutamyl-peptidase I [Metallosphaera hakonensis JCM 8857 = DSM 7519]